MAVYTGGLLNELNGRMLVSSARNSVPVMKLIRVHKPCSYGELVDLIEYHYRCDCECGIKSKGTVYDFGVNLYNAQLEYWGEYRFSLEECVEWEYNLFIVQSLKGFLMEDWAIFYLQGYLPLDFDIEGVSGFVDVYFGVDVVVKLEGVVVCGVQVKPLSYEYCCDDVKRVNVVKNSKFEVEVLYLFYDDGGFVNLCEVVGEIISKV